MKKSDRNVFVVILAGGQGARLWPLSTPDFPKQFLRLYKNKSFLRHSYNRARRLAPDNRIYIVTGKRYGKLTEKEIPEIPRQNIFLEPEGRNTGPALSVVANYLETRFGDCRVLVLTADHLIRKENEFVRIVKNADRYVMKEPNRIVTFGIVPASPDTEYGYVRRGRELVKINGTRIYASEKFEEKPKLAKARQFFRSGKYYWNSGMFMWDNRFFLECLKQHARKLFVGAEHTMAEMTSSRRNQILPKVFMEMGKISIDYALMNKLSDIAVVPADIGWTDVGGWNKLGELYPADSRQNIVAGRVRLVNSSNTVVYAQSKDVVVIDMDNVVVVESEHGVLVSRKKRLAKLNTLSS